MIPHPISAPRRLISKLALAGAALAFGLIAGSTTGCAHKPPMNEAAKPFLNQPHVTGRWSEPVNGITCRVLVDNTAVDDTGGVTAALEIWNTGDKPVWLRDAGRDALGGGNLVWAVGDSAFYPGAQPGAPSLKKKLPDLVLRPDERYIAGPMPLHISPTAAPNGGSVGISASFPVDDRGEKRLAAPAVAVAVAPTQWGQADQNLRTCIGVTDDTLEPTQALRLFLCINNAGPTDLKIPAYDWQSPRVAHHGNLVTITYAPAASAEGQVTDPPAGAIERRVLELPEVLVRPGLYHLRVVLEGTADHSAWSGTAVSNEIAVRVRE